MVSGIVTVILLLLFLAGCVWAWSPRRKRDFEAAAQLPLAENEQAGHQAASSQPARDADSQRRADDNSTPPSNPGETHRE